MIIGICGRAGSGKDTAADFLVKEHGFVKVALADPLKRIAREVFDFTDEQLWGPSEKRNEEDPRYPRYDINDKKCYCGKKFRDAEDFRDHLPCHSGPANLTPRYALQQLGTEWGRNCYSNVWVDYAIRVAKKLLEDGSVMYSAKEGIVPDYLLRAQAKYQVGDNKPAGIVISDVRFINEVIAIKAAGGKVWKIERPAAGLSGTAGQHASETEQEKIPSESFLCVIKNDMSLNVLQSLVAEALQLSRK